MQDEPDKINCHKINCHKINCLGQKCPIPVTRLENAWRHGHMNVELTTDDAVSLIDVPLFARQNDAIVLSQSEDEHKLTFLIQFKKAFDL